MLGDKTENLKMDVLATYLYRTGFSSKGGNHYGKASAIGVVLVVLCLLATWISSTNCSRLKTMRCEDTGGCIQ